MFSLSRQGLCFSSISSKIQGAVVHGPKSVEGRVVKFAVKLFVDGAKAQQADPGSAGLERSFSRSFRRQLSFPLERLFGGNLIVLSVKAPGTARHSVRRPFVRGLRDFF